MIRIRLQRLKNSRQRRKEVTLEKMNKETFWSKTRIITSNIRNIEKLRKADLLGNKTKMRCYLEHIKINRKERGPHPRVEEEGQV